MNMKAHTSQGEDVMRAYCFKHSGQHRNSIADSSDTSRAETPIPSSSHEHLSILDDDDDDDYLPADDSDSIGEEVEASDEEFPSRIKIKSRLSFDKRTHGQMPSPERPPLSAATKQSSSTRSMPTPSVAVVSRLIGSLTKLQLQKKQKFLSDAIKYWILKKQSVHGIPLLKRLRLYVIPSSSTTAAEQHALHEKLSYLRTNLEKARILAGLARKREFLSLELIRAKQSAMQLLLWPRESMMHQSLDRLEAFAAVIIIDCLKC